MIFDTGEGEDPHIRYCRETAEEHGLTHSEWRIHGTMFTEPHPYLSAKLLKYDDHGNDGVFAKLSRDRSGWTSGAGQTLPLAAVPTRPLHRHPRWIELETCFCSRANFAVP